MNKVSNIVSIRQVITNLVWLLLGGLICAVLMVGCGGGGLSAPNNGGSGLSNMSAGLTISAPVEYQNGGSQRIPVILTNKGTLAISNIKLLIVENTTNTPINIDYSSLQSNNYTISPGQTIQIMLTLSATESSGSFTLEASGTANTVANQSAAMRVLSLMSQQVGLDLSSTVVVSAPVVVGLSSTPILSGSGLDGVSFSFPSTITVESGSSNTFILTMAVNSPAVGNFNTLNLVDSQGNTLSYQVLSGNSGTNATALTVGDTVTLAVNIPSGGSLISFSPQLLNNSSIIPNGTTKNMFSVKVVNAASTPVAVVSVVPNYVMLSESSPSTVFTIVNSGNNVANNLDVAINGNGITIINSDCGSSLAANTSCNVTIGYNQATTSSGTSNVTLNYNNANARSSSTATISYLSPVNTVGINISSSNANFDYSVTSANPYESNILTITNPSKSTITLLSIDLPNYFSVSSAKSNSCSNNLQLSSGKSCNYILTYSNTTLSAGVITDQATVNYSYIDGNNNSQTTSSSLGLSYQTIPAEALLSSVVSNLAFANITEDGVSANTESITITNNGDYAVTNLAINIQDTNSIFNLANTTCGDTLAAGASCNISIKVGPLGINQIAAGAKSAKLNINYQTNTTLLATFTTPLSVQLLTAVDANLETVAKPTVSGFIAGTAGTLSNPLGIDQNSASPQVSYTFVNNSSYPANNLYLNESSLSNGWSLSNNTCGTLASPINLAANASCIITLSLATTSVGVANLDLSNVTLNWTNQDSTSSSQAISNSTMYATVFASPSLSINTNDISGQQLMPGESFVVNANLVGGYSVSQSVSFSASNGQISLSPSSCTLTSANPSCSVTVLANQNLPVGNYSVFINATGSQSLLGAAQQIDFKVYNNLAYIANGDSGIVDTCQIMANGDFNNCVANTASSNTLNGFAIAAYFAYTLDSIGNLVQCNLANGKISGCGIVNVSIANSTYGIFNPIIANNHLYFFSAASYIYIMASGKQTSPTLLDDCSLNADGSINSCSSINLMNEGAASFTTENSIAFAGNYAYAQENSAGSVMICPIVSGDVSPNCTVTNTNIVQTYMAINGNYAYIGSNGINDQGVYYCPVSNGSFGACSTTANGYNEYVDSISFFGNFAYVVGHVTGSSKSDISICPINSDGSLGTCSPTAISSSIITDPAGAIGFNQVAP